MLAFLAKLVAGPLVGKIVDLVKGYQDKKLSEAALRAEVEKTILSTFDSVAKTQSEVILAEINGGSRLQRLWRPITALLFVFIVFWFGFIQPLLVGWFNLPPLRVGDPLLMEILDIVKLCLGGYIGGRSLEKIVTTMRR
jgi:hypothetical protein